MIYLVDEEEWMRRRKTGRNHVIIIQGDGVVKTPRELKKGRIDLALGKSDA